MARVFALLLFTALALPACAQHAYYSASYGRGPYYGWGYDPYCCRGPGYVVVLPPGGPDIDGPDIEGPDIEPPEPMPLPEPIPDMGMPDLGDFDVDLGDF